MELHNETNPLPGNLDEQQAKKILKKYDIPVVEEMSAADADQAVAAARTLGYPVVVKGAGPALQHKTDRGLVHLHLTSDQEVRLAVQRIHESAGADLEFYLIQPEISGRRELMAGFYRDRQYGPVILFGLGGVLTEALQDVVLRLAPLTREDAEQMAGDIKARKLLGAFRGEASVNRETIVRALLGLSRFALEHPEITEVDINPLKVTPSGDIVAVDALVSVAVPTDSIDTNVPPPVASELVHAFFHPRGIAFVGASAQLGKWGHLLVVNTAAGEFQGDIYLVNPKGGTIAGRPVFRSLEDIPGPVDLAVLTLPAARTLDLVMQCQAKGIRRIVLITSGFGETGTQGKDLEAQVIAAARKAGILILGPNTMGIANPHLCLFCTGTTVMPQPGTTAMVSQSGNLGTQLLAFAEKQGLGIRAFAGSGNEAMITIEDYLEAFETDDLTQTIVLYLESAKNGRRFFESARRISRRKPIVLLKGGQSPIGLRAAASHTGALTTDNRVFDAMCRQSGLIKVEQPMELLDLAAAFSSLPIPRGGRTAVMTWGGGWGVVTVDLCHHHGLTVPALDQRIIEEIDAFLPPYWSRINPIDMVGEQDPSVALRILEILMAWEGCDAVINLGILGRRIFMDRFAQAVRKADSSVTEQQLSFVDGLVAQFEKDIIGHSVALMQRYRKPVIGVSLLTDEHQRSIYPLEGSDCKAVFYETPERAVKTLAHMAAYHRFRSRQD